MNVITAAALCFAIQTANTDGRIALKDDRVVFACEHSQAIIEAGTKYNIDPVIMASLIYYESRYEPTAVSRSNACGLTQVLPQYVPETCEQLKDPLTSINAGTRSLDYWLTKRKKKRYEEALACYNAGNACLKNSRGKNYSSKVRSLARWLTRKAATFQPKKANHWVTTNPTEESTVATHLNRNVPNLLAPLTIQGWVNDHNSQGGSHIGIQAEDAGGSIFNHVIPPTLFYQPIIGPYVLNGVTNDLNNSPILDDGYFLQYGTR